MSRRSAGPFVRAVLLWAPLLGLGILGCDAGVDTPRRTVSVEVTSSPSGLPVTIRLNGTTREATTPVAQDIAYEATCGGVSGNGGCVLFGSVEVKESDRSRTQSLRLCLADGGKRECESTSFWAVNVNLAFEP